MLTQTNIKSAPIDFFSLPVAQQNPYTYDGEEQLTDEMTNCLPEIPQSQPIPKISSDDFEILYGRFLS